MEETIEKMRILPEPNSIIRRDCYWYGWGSHPSIPGYCYSRELGAQCFHPKVDDFFINLGTAGLDRITPNCSKCPYLEKCREPEVEEEFLAC